MAESARCIFSLKKMHQDDKNTILRQTMHRVPLQNELMYFARIQSFAIRNS